MRAKLFVQAASSIVGITGWYSIAVFILAALVAAWAGWSGVRGTLVDAAIAVAAVAAWSLAALTATNPNGKTLTNAYVVGLAVGSLVLAALVSRAVWARPTLFRRPATS